MIFSILFIIVAVIGTIGGSLFGLFSNRIKGKKREVILLIAMIYPFVFSGVAFLDHLYSGNDIFPWGTLPIFSLTIILFPQYRDLKKTNNG